MSVPLRDLPVGKPAGIKLESRQRERKGTDGVARCFQEIAARRKPGDRTKTDTGGCEEYSQAREITPVKELCKLSS